MNIPSPLKILHACDVWDVCRRRRPGHKPVIRKPSPRWGGGRTWVKVAPNHPPFFREARRTLPIPSEEEKKAASRKRNVEYFTHAFFIYVTVCDSGRGWGGGGGVPRRRYPTTPLTTPRRGHGNNEWPRVTPSASFMTKVFPRLVVVFSTSPRLSEAVDMGVFISFLQRLNRRQLILP